MISDLKTTDEARLSRWNDEIYDDSYDYHHYDINDKENQRESEDATEERALLQQNLSSQPSDSEMLINEVCISDQNKYWI
uniref:Uncharacterized protein n=1 Tax=Setaria digitata TaxID=48799 RepID=A0A915PM69_9BILA